MGFSDQFGLGVVLSMKNLISASAQAARKDLKDLADTAVKTQSWVTKSSQQLADEQRDILKGYRAVGIAATAAGTAILGSMAFMAKQAADSETYMARVKVNLLASGTAATLATQQVGGLFTEIEKVSDALGTDKDAMEAAAASITQLLGYDQARASLKSIGQLSVATHESIATSAEAVSDVLRIYSDRWGEVMTKEEKAARAATALFNAAKMSGMEFTAFNQIMKQTSAESATMGLSLEESAGTLAFMSKIGPSGRVLMGGIRAYYEGLRQAMTKTGAPMTWDEMMSGPKPNDPRAIMAGLGVSLTNPKGQGLSFYETLIGLEKHYNITAEKSAEVQRQINAGLLTGAAAADAYGIKLEQYAALEQIYSQAGAESLVMALGRSTELKKIIDSVGDKVRLKEAVDTMMGTLAHWVAAIKNVLMSTADVLGQPLIDWIKDIAKDIYKFILGVKQFATEHPTITKWVMGIGALAGAILLVGGAIVTLTTTWLIASAVMMATPVGWILAGIAVLIVGIVALVAKWDWVKDKLLWVWTQIKTAAIATFNYLSDYITDSPIYQLFKWIFEMTEAGIHKVRSILGIRDEAGISTVMGGAVPNWGIYAQPNPTEAAAELVTLARGNVSNSADYSNRWITNNIRFAGGNPTDQGRVIQRVLDEAAIRGLPGEAPSQPMPNMGWR